MMPTETEKGLVRRHPVITALVVTFVAFVAWIWFLGGFASGQTKDVQKGVWYQGHDVVDYIGIQNNQSLENGVDAVVDGKQVHCRRGAVRVSYDSPTGIDLAYNSLSIYYCYNGDRVTHVDTIHTCNRSGIGTTAQIHVAQEKKFTSWERKDGFDHGSFHVLGMCEWEGVVPILGIQAVSHTNWTHIGVFAKGGIRFQGDRVDR